MSEATRKYILDYCKKSNITPADLEREGSISRDAIYAFVIGKVTDLKLNTAISIADLFSISLDELAGRKNFLKKTMDENSIALPINDILLEEIVSFVSSYIEHNNLYKYNSSKVIYAINEIYEYCIRNKLPTIDKNFAEYICESQMHLL